MSERGIAPGLLIAMPQLQDPNFERSVVLMVEHTENGSFGLILNRPGELDLTGVLDSLGVEWQGDPEAVVWTGGPVMPRTGWLLHEPMPLPGDEGTLDIAPGVALSTSPERSSTRPPRRCGSARCAASASSR
jgi:putative transcriptional regulator